ncbi:MAG: YhbY family RNA-binding protein [Proteobacteria bacterium]|nr:YhbY family RNA-binding protein [Verrucomicrobiota bacterium]NBU09519.1 YhbY family RNA-binding protein [Pseudomonadota bacterium]
MNEPLPNPAIRKLKGLAQKLDPVLALGKAGVTDAFVKSLDEALGIHELVKMKFAAFKDERKTLAPQLAEKTNSHLVWVVGHVAVFYRQQPDAGKRKVAV